MPAPTFHHCGGDIFDDAGKLIEPAEAAILLETCIRTANAATNRAVIRDQLRTARTLSLALVGVIEFALCADSVVNIRTAARERVRAMFARCPEVQPETAA